MAASFFCITFAHRKSNIKKVIIMRYGNNKWYDGCLTAIGLAVIGLVLGVIYAFVISIFGVWLWNYAMVSMFNVPQITFWQMLALMVLARLFIPLRINYNNNKNIS